METINLNGKEYVLMEEYNKLIETKERKPAKRFSSTKEQKIITALNKMFDNNGDETISEDEAVEKGVCVIDCANCLMVGAKTEEAKRILAHYSHFEGEKKEMPSWDFISKDNKPSSSKLSMEYMTKIMNFFGVIGCEAIRISCIHNHPIKIEDDNFAFVLAPRIEGDD
jgi:hypothetical protein